MGRSRTTWMRLKNSIEAHYVEANTKAGTRLPNMTDLCDLFKASRKTIDKALDRLLIEGILSYRVSTGLVWTGIQVSTSVPRGALHHVLELRLAIEPMAARLATRALSNGTAGAGDRSAFERAYVAVGDSLESDDVKQAYSADKAFHSAMLRLVENPMLRASVERMEHWLGDNVKDVVTDLFKVKDYRTNTDQQHSAIYEAIIGGEEDEAYRAAYNHLDYAHGLIVLRYRTQQTG